MKKIYTFGLAIAAVAALAACNKENIGDTPSGSKKISVKASIEQVATPDSKVTIAENGNKFNLNWQGTESLGLANSTNTYTKKDWAVESYSGTTATLTGSSIALGDATTTNWILATNLVSSTSEVIRATLPDKQSYDGANMGQNCLLVARADDADVAEVPGVEFKTMNAFMKFSLVKGSAEGSSTSFDKMYVQKITVEAIGGEPLAGRFEISKTAADWTGAYSGAVTGMTYPKVTLDCTANNANGEELTDTAKDFYVAIAFGTYASGLKVTINVQNEAGDVGKVEKTFGAASGVTIARNTMRALAALTVNPEVAVPVEISSLESGQADQLVQGQVTAHSTKGFILTDNTGSIFVYTNSDESGNYSIGQTVSVFGNVGQYNFGLQINNPTVTARDEGSYSYPTPETFTETEVLDYINNTSTLRLAEYVTLSGSLKIGTYHDISVGGGGYYNVTLYSPLSGFTSGLTDGDFVTVTGYVINVTSMKCAVIPTEVVVQDVPGLTYENITGIAAEGVTDATLAVTATNASGWTASVMTDGTIVTAASINEGLDTITYTVSENSDADDRTGIITVTFTKDGEPDVPYKIYVTQDGTVFIYTLDGTKTGGSNSYTTESEMTQDDITWMVMGNTTMSPWRIGGKSVNKEDRTVYSTTPMEQNISKIVIVHGGGSDVTVNSMTVTVASDASFNNVVSTFTPTFGTGANAVTVERPSGANWSNCYYKIVYNISISVNSNRFFTFSYANFYAE